MMMMTQSAANDAMIEKLKGKVKEDEATIVNLKNEKDRLEQYTRKTLQTVQEKVREDDDMALYVDG